MKNRIWKITVLIVLILNFIFLPPFKNCWAQQSQNKSIELIIIDPQNQTTTCSKAFSSLISALNEVLPDTSVHILDQLDKSPHTRTTWLLNCAPSAESPAKITFQEALSGEIKFTFNYSEKAEAIEATDLLTFQRHMAGHTSAPHSETLSLEDLKPQHPLSPMGHSQEDYSITPIYKKWWFWGIVAGGVAASVAVALNMNQQHSGARVTSH